MVIDLEAFQDICVNNVGDAQVGGGVRLGNLALGIYNQSRRALPHGVCPGVGVGGHASHGGYCKSTKDALNVLSAIRKENPTTHEAHIGF